LRLGTWKNSSKLCLGLIVFSLLVLFILSKHLFMKLMVEFITLAGCPIFLISFKVWVLGFSSLFSKCSRVGYFILSTLRVLMP